MKTKYVFLAALALAVLTYVYVTWLPHGSFGPYMSSPQTVAWEQGERFRLILFITAAAGFVSACVLAFRKPKAALAIWAIVLLVVTGRTFIPGFPPPSSLPFARLVLWTGIVAQVVLWICAIRCQPRKAEAQR